MTIPEFSRVLGLLEQCRDRVAALSAGAALLQQPLDAELSVVRQQLDAAVAEMCALRPAALRPTPTPATLRKLLTLAREDLAEQLTTSETPSSSSRLLLRWPNGWCPVRSTPPCR